MICVDMITCTNIYIYVHTGTFFVTSFRGHLDQKEKLPLMTYWFAK